MAARPICLLDHLCLTFALLRVLNKRGLYIRFFNFGLDALPRWVEIVLLAHHGTVLPCLHQFQGVDGLQGFGGLCVDADLFRLFLEFGIG